MLSADSRLRWNLVLSRRHPAGTGGRDASENGRDGHVQVTLSANQAVKIRSGTRGKTDLLFVDRKSSATPLFVPTPPHKIPSRRGDCPDNDGIVALRMTALGVNAALLVREQASEIRRDIGDILHHIRAPFVDERPRCIFVIAAGQQGEND